MKKREPQQYGRCVVVALLCGALFLMLFGTLTPASVDSVGAKAKLIRFGALIDSLKTLAAYADAESVAAETIYLGQSTYGAEASRLAPWLTKLGQIRFDVARYDDALLLFRRVLDIEQAHGSGNSETALSAMRG